MTDKPKRRWYQYSLRTLFVVMTLVAVGCSWYAYEMNEAAKRRAALAEIERLGGYVGYYDASNPNSDGEPPKWHSWLRKLHGDEYLGYVAVVNLVSPEVTDAVLVNLKDLKSLELLILLDTQITDAGLAHLKGLENLEELYLVTPQVTDEGVKQLQEALPNCEIER